MVARVVLGCLLVTWLLPLEARAPGAPDQKKSPEQ